MTLSTQDENECLTKESNATNLTLESFLPTASCDAAVVKGKGAFISVDSRPITSLRGTAKKLATCLKTHLSRALNLSGLPSSMKSPFMQLNIRCSSPSYDANVATMKDEVLFADESSVLDSFSSLCEKLYLKSSLVQEATTKAIDQSRSHPDTSARDWNASPMEDFPQRREESPEDDLLGDDPEFIDALERMSTPVASSMRDAPQPRACGYPGTFSSGGCTDTASLVSDLVAAKMRTIKSVNMAREDSNTTDEDTTAGMIDVQIAPRPIIASQRNEPEQTHQVGGTREFQDLHRYFKPKNERDIQIATDETATSGGTHSADASGHKRRSGRRPLQPLTDSALNILSHEMDETSDSSNREGDLLSPHRSLTTDFDSPLTERELDAMHERFPPDEPAGPRLNHSRSPNFHSNLSLRTPPPTNPFRIESIPNPSLRPPRRDHSTAQPSPLIDNDGPRQTRIALRGRANERLGLERQSRPLLDGILPLSGSEGRTTVRRDQLSVQEGD